MGVAVYLTITNSQKLLFVKSLICIHEILANSICTRSKGFPSIRSMRSKGFPGGRLSIEAFDIIGGCGGLFSRHKCSKVTINFVECH